MSNRIITISRQFGSGGRTIGKEVAAKLGIPCYDNELIEHIAQESGFAKGSRESVERFRAGLEQSGITATVRRTLGPDINASCGQLRRAGGRKASPLGEG